MWKRIFLTLVKIFFSYSHNIYNDNQLQYKEKGSMTMHSNSKTYTIFSYKRIIGGVLPAVPIAFKIRITSQKVIVKEKISPLMYVANLPFSRQAMMCNTRTIIKIAEIEQGRHPRPSYLQQFSPFLFIKINHLVFVFVH